MNISIMKWKNLAPATGFLEISLYLSLYSLSTGENVSFVSAKYNDMGCILSAGEKVMNQDGAPRNDMRDQISFLMYFLLVIDPLTCPPT